MKSIAKAGAEASKKVQRERALKKYIEVNPHCLYCNAFIPPPPIEKKTCSNSWAKAARRKFCSYSCCGKYNWKRGTEVRLGKKMTFQNTQMTLEEAKIKYKNWEASIRNHGKLIYRFKNNNKCEKCGYDKHINVCHIKAIKNHLPTDTIAKINSPTNLIGLCPNCHWELDNLL